MLLTYIDEVLQGSAITQIVLGGLIIYHFDFVQICYRVHLPKIMNIV